MQLDRAAKVQLVRLLERDVEEAEALELLCTGERPDIERPQPTVGDELRRVAVDDLELGAAGDRAGGDAAGPCCRRR